MNKRYYFYSLPMILLLIVAVAGWFATDYLGNKARQEIVGESQALLLTLTIHVSSIFTITEGAVKSLAGSPWIAPALMFKRDQDIEHASSALDRYNSALNASVSYLMDADGMVVASSNRKDPDSFVGKSYSFRPYFQEAAKGQPGRYFALGITSGKRGFYASYPVQNRLGKVLGVVTMKKDLDEMETFFSRHPFCFLINPDGIIFMSSSPEMFLKSLWPLDKLIRGKLIASQQFGNKLSEAFFFKKEITDGTEAALEGKDYFVSRKVFDSDGWSIVLLTPTDRIRLYKLIGILATIFVCLLIMVFLGIIYVTDRSKEAIRQSEESKRLLLHAAGDGIFGVDATGQVTFINPAALRMLGFAEEEMLGQSVHALIHHSHADGSNYPVEDCPMYASYAKATECHVTDGLLWRKDGSSFPVEYSSMPITKDGKIMGAVVTFKDITERKQSEEKIQQMVYHDSLTGLPNRKLFSDRLGIALAQAQRNQQEVGIAMLDLDHFKDVNDIQGHDVGDLLLKAAAERLSAALRKGDTVARFGGDEFLLILPDMKVIEDAIQVAQKIVDSFRKPFLIDTHQLVVTTSIGIAVYPNDGIDEGILLKNADIAMYQAKQAGGSRYHLSPLRITHQR
jgi:diguanylate cyclase (GGDEF)-like protein/PAS domain S-box-containing protein